MEVARHLVSAAGHRLVRAPAGVRQQRGILSATETASVNTDDPRALTAQPREKSGDLLIGRGRGSIGFTDHRTTEPRAC